MQIELYQPNPDDRPIIKNLFAFYRYDLMPFIDNDIGGRPNWFGAIGYVDVETVDQSVADVDLWWTKPGVLLPMLIRVDGIPAGFAMVARPPHAHRSVDFRMEDFFVLNRWRRSGVGRAAAAAVFERYPGRWEMGWLAKNVAADKFWRCVIASLGTAAEDWTVENEPGAPGLPGVRTVITKH